MKKNSVRSPVQPVIIPLRRSSDMKPSLEPRLLPVFFRIALFILAMWIVVFTLSSLIR